MGRVRSRAVSTRAAAAAFATVALACAAVGVADTTGIGTIPVAAEGTPASDPSAGSDDGTGEAEESGVAAEQANPGIELEVSFDVDSVSRIAAFDSELHLERGRFDGVIYEEDGENKLRGDLDIPASDGYFVAFDFMPVTSTVELLQHEEVTGTSELDLVNQRAHVEMEAELFVALSDVRQDGIPLRVGDECRTRVPATIEITGWVNLVEGAESEMDQSVYAIPTFTGCGSAEDLDPLMTGLVAGEGNLLDTTLTTRCVATCPVRE
ncbi:hypothetical protein H0B56_08180 [Haloechinothrix sp. YIM 98757]|uniref:Polyisoprenoid-binding protein YceI n=1 Tax=Haloechinothrix aidingensis TaxID=2752311 RepID=A0A837ZXZ9_9PSEU|nr:hypothetical protein [Haloechinothrix aidingensis]MBA0125516.1 hypothetical protein [Haloechinothrix aidingensis]